MLFSIFIFVFFAAFCLGMVNGLQQAKGTEMVKGQRFDDKRPVLRKQRAEDIRILLIEDNPGYSEVIRIILDKARDIRFEMTSATRLSEGLDYLSKDGIDLILLDLKLPDSLGIETFDKVYTRAPNVPIIVLTAIDNDELAIEAMQKGAQDFLVKEQVDGKSLAHAIRYAIERKRMEEMLLNAAQEWRSTFDAISDVVCLIDSERKIIRCNKAMTKLFDMSFVDIIGQCCCELIHGTRELIEGCPFERMQKTRQTESIVLQRGDQWFNISVDPLLNEVGDPIGGVHIMADITKEKEIDQMKSELISNVSHELRTPLSTIKEGIALVYDGTLGPLQADQKDMLLRVKKNIDRLTRLINDLLDMSKIEAGRMQLMKSSVNMLALIEEVLSSFRDQAKNKDIEFSTRVEEDMLPLHIDRDRICQALTNLITNSIKFSAEHGRITVGIKDTEKEAHINVADNGVGISAKNISGLFDRFSQFNRDYGPGERGTGLGLPISKEIIEMHGGRIWVESEPEKGSIFTFSLPRMSQDEIFREYLTTGLREATDKNCPLSLVVLRMKNIEKFERDHTTETVFMILCEIERLIARTLRRKSDIVSRYKYGEIIIAILMDTAKKDALLVKERIKRAIEDEMQEKGWPKDIELFLDIVTYPDDATDEVGLIKKISKKLWGGEITDEETKGGQDG